MKITGIHINDFRQFKDFHLDLTYPKGHKKEGKPLDKVCFIGQSGTGKTTLLNMIKELISHKDYQFAANFKNLKYSIGIKFGAHNIHIYEQNKILALEDNNNVRYSFEKYLNSLSTQVINITSDIIERFSLIERHGIEDPLQYIKTDAEIKKIINEERTRLKSKRFFDFGKDDPLEIWKTILMDASDYMVKELKYSQQITKALIKDPTKADELVSEFKSWQQKGPNPFTNLAKVLNPIINRFCIRIKTDFDFEKAEDLKFIKVETLKKVGIPFDIWSTGTKQVILTATPIFKLDTTNTIILFDEPERSLYPDIQKEIIDYYTNLAPKAQFFYATHSPIISSSFEPWEIVELKFDYNKGVVYREEYYDTSKERHVDNYFINPQYLRWDSILTKVFDMKERGNEKRVEKLMELAAIGKKIEKETDKSKKAEIYQEYKKLSELLDWETK